MTVATEGQLEDVRALFREYFHWLKEEHGIDIGYQGLAEEMAGLPGCYAPPMGNLWLAEDGNGAVAGCVALRPLADGACELKRMYLRPEYRGRGLGKALGQVVVDEARRLGYRVVRLDSADILTTALRVYASLGFRPCAPYYDAPPEIRFTVVYMDQAL